MSILEIVGVIVSALAIWLTARRNMACWPVGLVSVALYGWIFRDARLYSDMLLQGAFAVLQIYGWGRWLAQRAADAGGRAGRPHATNGRATASERVGIEVLAVPLRALLPGLACAVVASGVLGSLMAHFTDAALPFIDATLTSFSLVAQYWTARRYIASWWLWSAVNVVYVGMFAFKGLYPTSALYAVFIALAVIGWRDWHRALVRQDAGESRPSASLI